MKKETTFVLTEEEKKRAKKISLIDSILTFLCMGTVVGVLLFNFQVATVPTTSMYPTLAVKEMVLVDKIHGDPAECLDYGDIVVFTQDSANGQRTLIKRLIGMPGDTIEVTDTAIYLNGEKIKDPYRIENQMIFTMEEITLGEDEYFLMGDNRNNSSDCRVFGPIKDEAIQGKAIFHCQFFPDEACDTFVNNVLNENKNPEYQPD